MIIIRGKITKDTNPISLTCCYSTASILIDDKRLHDILDEHFDLNLEKDDDIDSNIGVSYLILDENPGDIKDYNSFIANWIIRNIYSEYISGCYSELTCGPGSYDYFFGEEGHNLSQEFSSFIGKYLILRIDDKRDIIIDDILNDNT